MQAAKADWRCRAATAATNADSPIGIGPWRWATATLITSCRAATSWATFSSNFWAVGCASYSREATLRPWSLSRTSPENVTTAPATLELTDAASSETKITSVVTNALATIVITSLLLPFWVWGTDAA